jgi:hypothetical protein
MSKHQQMMEKFRKRSLELSRQAAISENRVKKQVRKTVRRINPFDIQDINWAEERWASK